MNVLYVSTLCSENTLNRILLSAKNKPLQSIQKFNRLICEGMITKGDSVQTMSQMPISRYTHSGLIYLNKKESINGVEYKYLPIINIPFIKQIVLMIFIAINIILYSFKKDKVIICDVLNMTLANITLKMAKLLNIKIVGIVTDLPEDMANNKVYQNTVGKDINKYDGYIVITEEMHKKINKQNKPYMVMEGLVDSNMNNEENLLEQKYAKKVLIYAGGLYEKYGVKYLIDGVLRSETKDLELWLYGSGDLEQYIKELKNDKIKYFGVVENKKIVEAETKATLLVNPRFTNEEYTKYSFPSKNMEYMVSGTPVLTTKLPGMPKEYNEYVYLIEKETTEGIISILDDIFKKTKEQLNDFGIKAKEFVLKNKNNKMQGERILNFVKTIK